ncbi:MAG TPA: WXG100 family type VII secretion target [Pseudonocardia sp.]|jgi:6 kDa early secretory antigenic target|nr:WXG100 family type VII secretion target [Pseudonocardia sp.]
MAVDGYGATTEEMARAAQHVASVNQSVQGELSALRGRLEPLAGAWVGQAAAQFAQLMIRWDTDARALNQALGGIGHAIEGSRNTYQRQEDDQLAAMTSISNALG